VQPIDTLLVFFMASVLLALTPGPDNLFVMAQAVQRGKMAGIAVTIGLCTGLLVHTSAVALGVAAIFQASAIAFSLLKFIGAAYLLYLAYRAFSAGVEDGDEQQIQKLNFGRLYGRGIIMNVTNPKVSIFFLAFLPQFTDPAFGPLIPQILLLGLLFILSTILIFGGISLLAGGVGGYFRKSSRAQLVLNRIAGGVFIALAVKLALVRR
jgi:threonine/homoserine/homoserine lactone efflux protein